MDTLVLTASARDTGKKATKATRLAGNVPCVLYGPHTEPVHFAVPTLALRPLIHTTEQHRVTVNVGGESLDAILKEVVFHPVTERPWHVDFQALTAGETFTTTVPVVLVGTPEAVKDGADLAQPMNGVELRALPKDLPGSIEADVSALQIGDSLHVRDLTVPEGVEILTDGDLTIATLQMSTLGADIEEADAELAEEQAAEYSEEHPETAEDADDVPATEQE